ncbi:uracil-DNA glycosylase [Azohydromonas caseinilytica]|uniref:Type-4 uracil-DNA glycosylase n=1 Tax=Azohydromonas caseinilytica TaxID=2728836 RepID=A0A848F6C3_9BURK|nr:uracil-DNA glycosylase [Azohydromonas caseinilytica]NML13651.1 uracil-DNA glycosylase [Azohydromonas caseinilytica]
MAYSERQLQMLEWMGIRLWQPPVGADAVPTPEPAAAEAAQAEIPATPAYRAVTAAPSVGTAVAQRPLPRAAGAGTASAASAPAVAQRVDGPIDVAPGLPFGGGEVAALDWPALRSAVENCRACALCNSRRHTVFGVGNERAHWMIVGEAPGEQEDLRGEPFVGPAGQLLDAMLAALGLTREAAPAERQVFIANTLKCRPPRNRNPAPEELAQCEPYLQRQLALVQPRVILAMGRFAVQSLLRSTLPIGKLRGQVHRYQGIPLVVTYHPAYLLRNPVDKARAWDDLCLAASLVEPGTAAA